MRNNQTETQSVVYLLPDGTELELSCVAMEGEDVDLISKEADYSAALASYIALCEARRE